MARWIRVGGGLAILGFMVLSAWTFRQVDPDRLLTGLSDHYHAFRAFSDGEWADGRRLVDQGREQMRSSALGLGLGFAALGAAGTLWLRSRLGVRPPGWLEPVCSPLRPARVRWIPAVLGIGALAVVTGASTGALGLDHLLTDVQCVLFCAGIGLVVWGFGGGSSFPRIRPAARRRVIPVLLVAGLALVLRVWNLEYAVHRLVDEVHFIEGVNRLEADHSTGLLTRFSDVTAFPYLFPYLQAKAVAVLGHNLAAIRVISAVIGAAHVVAVYALGVTLFNRRTAILAALVLTAFPPHIQFSRLGLNHIADPFFGTLAMLFFARGLRGHHRQDWVLGGACLGLTQYFYEGGRLLYPPLIVLWIVALAVIWRGHITWRGVGIALLVFVIVAAPVYITLTASRETLAPRLATTGLGTDYFVTLFSDPALRTAHLEHIAVSLLLYVYLPDRSWFYTNDTPLVNGYLAPFFLAGLVIAAWRWRTPGALLLWLWLITNALGASTLIDSASMPRFVVMFPALVLLAALGIGELADLLTPRSWPEVRRVRAARSGAVIVAGVVVAGHIAHTLGPFLNDYNDRVRPPGLDAEDAVFRSFDLPPGTQVLIVDDGDAIYYRHVEWMFDFWDVSGVTVHPIKPDAIAEESLAVLPRDVGYAFFVDPGDARVIGLLKQVFAVGDPRFSPDRYNVPPDKQFALFYVPPVVFRR